MTAGVQPHRGGSTQDELHTHKFSLGICQSYCYIKEEARYVDENAKRQHKENESEKQLDVVIIKHIVISLGNYSSGRSFDR
jgi:hypothetical protein